MDKVTFSQTERDFIKGNEACRIATCHDGIPHVVPVSYIFEHDAFFIATDYETRKYENITAEIIERGQEFASLYRMFHDRFEWVRRDSWKEGEAPFVKVTPTNKVSWGLE